MIGESTDISVSNYKQRRLVQSPGGENLLKDGQYNLEWSVDDHLEWLMLPYPWFSMYMLLRAQLLSHTLHFRSLPLHVPSRIPE